MPQLGAVPYPTLGGTGAAPLPGTVLPQLLPPGAQVGSCKQAFNGGCSEWDDKNLRQHFANKTQADCAARCQRNAQCGGFFYGARGPNLGKCSLVKPGCTTDGNQDWSYFACQATAAAGAPPAVPAAPPAAPAAPANVAAPAGEKQYNCDEGYVTWMTSWPDEKKKYCCKHQGRGCPSVATGGCAAPPAGGTLAPGGCTGAAAVATTTAGRSYNCDEGFAICHTTWSPLKARWCAEERHKVCPNPPSIAAPAAGAVPVAPPLPGMVAFPVAPMATHGAAPPTLPTLPAAPLAAVPAAM